MVGHQFAGMTGNVSLLALRAMIHVPVIPAKAGIQDVVRDSLNALDSTKLQQILVTRLFYENTVTFPPNEGLLSAGSLINSRLPSTSSHASMIVHAVTFAARRLLTAYRSYAYVTFHTAFRDWHSFVYRSYYARGVSGRSD